ncbi:hypothetical protein STEG23_026023, partial [Scotinomys teguina]
MEMKAAAPRCQLLLILLMSVVMLLPGTNGSLLLVQRTVTRTIVLQENIGKGTPYSLLEFTSGKGKQALVLAVGARETVCIDWVEDFQYPGIEGVNCNYQDMPKFGQLTKKTDVIISLLGAEERVVTGMFAKGSLLFLWQVACICLHIMKLWLIASGKTLRGFTPTPR